MRARREVISSAGPYGSPKLLQLSGIGPAALLASVGVPLVQDLPVGQAVQACAPLDPPPLPAHFPNPHAHPRGTTRSHIMLLQM